MARAASFHYRTEAHHEPPGSAPDSLLVAFEGRTHFRAFMGLQFERESALGTRVDLVTPKAMKPALRSHIERDLIHVA